MDVITGQENIGDVASLHPEITHILMKYGLHCVGCHVSYWETLEEGAKGHGMDEETFNKMIKEINECIGKEEKDEHIIQISSFAIEKVKEMMKKGDVNGVLRIKVITDKEGNSYEFHVEKEEKDVIFEKNGLKISIDKESLRIIKGSKIDYLEGIEGSGFKVDNPNTSKTQICN